MTSSVFSYLIMLYAFATRFPSLFFSVGRVLICSCIFTYHILYHFQMYFSCPSRAPNLSYISIYPSNCFIPSSSLSSIIFIFRIETLFSFHLSLTVLVLASVIFALHNWSAWCYSCSCSSCIMHSLRSTAADTIFSPITPQSFLLLSLFILLCCDKNT